MTLLRVLAAVLLAAPAASPQDSRPAGRAFRIGVLFWHDSPNDRQAFVGVRDGLAVLGRPCEFDVAEIAGDRERGRAVVARWNAESVDLVFAMGTEAALICRDAAGRVPVVYTAVTNPVRSGLVPSWEGSGRNLAGNSNWIPAARLIETFRSAIPGLQRLGVILDPTNPVSTAELEEAVAYLAERQGPTLVTRHARTPADVDSAATELLPGVDALWIPIDKLIYDSLPRLLAAAAAARRPLVSSSRSGALGGAVVGLIADYRALGMKAADIARRVLIAGEAPGSIPVGTMTAFRCIVNLRSAAEIGLSVPLEFVASVDEVLR